MKTAQAHALHSDDTRRDAAQLGEAIEVLRRIEQLLTTLVAQGSRAGRGGERSITDADRKVLAAALPILGAGLGPDGRGFTAAEALGDVHRERELDISAKALGKLFARCVGVPVDGFRIRRDGNIRGSTAWRVWRV